MLPLVLCIIFTSVGALLVTLFLCEKNRQYSVKATLLKTRSSLFFIATCSVGLYMHEQNRLSLFIMLGLLLGLLGDIWLDLKYVFREKDKVFTYAGFIAFAFGHVLYLSGLISYYYQGQNVLYLILPFVGGILGGFLTIALEKPMKLHYGNMKLISLIYASILFSMVFMTLSFCIMYQFQVTNLILFFIGGVLFLASDLILSGTYFGEGKERPVDIITNTVTYYSAQYIIAFSVLFII